MGISLVENGLAIAVVGTAAYFGLNWLFVHVSEVYEMLGMMIQVPM